MDAATLIQKALEQREQWVALDDDGAKRVRVRRPPGAHVFEFGRNRTPEVFLRTAVGWDGFTEADILGAGVGSSDPVPFNVDLWVTLALDRIDWIGKVSEVVTTAITQYIEATEAIAKN
jgi:hypothetical protein